MTTRSRRHAATVTGLLVTAVLAGCTGGGSGTTAARPAGTAARAPTEARATPAADPGAAVAAAYDATVAAHTAKYVAQGTVDTPLMTVSVRLVGVVDFDRFLREEVSTATATVTTSLPGMTPGAVPDSTTHRRQVGDVEYEDGDAVRLEDATKTWLRTDRRRTDVGGLSSLLTRGGHGEPVQAWAHLRGLGAPVEVVGPEQVAGVPTVHYRATLRIDRVLTGENAGKSGVRQSMESSHLDGSRFDVWLDAAGRLRKIVPPKSPGEQGVVTMFTAFGVPVTVVEPAAADSVDLLVGDATAPGPTETP